MMMMMMMIWNINAVLPSCSVCAFNMKSYQMLLCVIYLTGVDLSADIMLCYKNGRTAHLITRGDCRLPNSGVIWGTKGLIEVSASIFILSSML